VTFSRTAGARGARAACGPSRAQANFTVEGYRFAIETTSAIVLRLFARRAATRRQHAQETGAARWWRRRA